MNVRIVRFIALIGMILIGLPSWGRQYVIMGKVTDAQRGDSALIGASVRLLKADSSFVAGQSILKSDGIFKFRPDKLGQYILELKFVGYATRFQNVELTSKADSINIGKVSLSVGDITLGNATVRARALETMMKKDTIVFNAAAFKTMEGSTLKKLVEQLPGVVVDDDGGITVNGKAVTEIKINGKDFFKGDTKVAMENLPVNLVDKVKTYEEKSDYSKYTGVEDGEKKTVLDINLKKELKSTITSNGTIGGGTAHRYRDELFMNRFTDLTRQTLYGNMTNLNGWGWGLRANKDFGTNLQWMNKEKWGDPGRYQISAGLRYGHGSSDVTNSGNSETFLTASDVRSFANSLNASQNWNSNYNADAHLEWNIDSLSFLYAYSNLGYSKNNGWTNNRSATFNADPYEIETMVNPLDNIYSEAPNDRLMNIAVNRNTYQSKNNGRSRSLGAGFGLFHRLDTLGQNISLQASLNMGDSRSYSYNLSDIQYYQVTGTRPQSFYDQYITSPTRSWSMHVNPSYIYAFTKQLRATLNYRFFHSYNDNDKVWYELDSLVQYQAHNHPVLGTLPTADSLALAYNLENSQYSTYNEYEHSFSLGLNYYKEKAITFNATLELKPHHTRLHYQKGTFNETLRRDIVNFNPRLYFKYEFTDNHHIDFNYNAGNSYPSMLNLIDIPDNSNPLYVTRGNPDLKPSWNNNFSLNYHLYSPKLQQSVHLHHNFQQTSNSISNTITYIPETGGQRSRPENINGNWRSNTHLSFQKSIGKNNKYQVEARSGTSYDHNVGYISVGSGENLVNEKNTVRTLNLHEHVGAAYRITYFDLRIGVDYDLQHSHADRQNSANLNVHGMGYIFMAHIRTKWNTELGSRMRIRTRRGYDDPQMNTNEYLWNMDLTQSFLKERRLTVGMEVYDILHSRKNISRNVWATGKSETRTNTIGTYVLFKLTYKLNLFGGGQL